MAGEFYLFNAAKEWEGDGTLDYDSHTHKAALVTNAVTPSASTSAPCWGSGGSTNLSSSEVTPGGNYSAGGVTLGSVTWTESGGTVTFDSADISIAQHASNPTNARWMIVYSDTATNKNCVGYVDLGGVTDLSAGGFSYTVSASGWFNKT